MGLWGMGYRPSPLQGSTGPIHVDTAQVEKDKDTSVIFASEPKAPQNEAYRHFIQNLMREIGMPYAMKVDDALQLLAFLAPDAICSLVVCCNARRHNSSTERVTGLLLKACTFTRDPPTIDPSVEVLRLLSVAIAVYSTGG